MKLTAKIKLLPTPEQRRYLLETMRCFNPACNHISDVAWETRTFRQLPLHHRVYHTVKDPFGLLAQMAVRANARVVDAYKLDRRAKHTFRELDDRVLSWKMDASTVSSWTVEGRQALPFACGEYLNSVRHRRLRRKLQKKGSVNHPIAKRIVGKGQRTNRAVALENLREICQGVRAGGPQCCALHSWAFHDLGQKLWYKARRAGVLLVFVDSRKTSRGCSACGHTERANAVCTGCRATVNWPNVGEASRVMHGSVPASPDQNGFGRGS